MITSDVYYQLSDLDTPLPTLKLVTYPNPILRKVALPVIRVEESYKYIAQRMHEIMDSVNGIGLAAQQVGLHLSLIVVKNLRETILQQALPEKLTLFNPEIIQKEGTQKIEEGCLSFPKEYLMLESAELIQVTYLDENNEQKTIQVDGLTAACIQHEIDHLKGILFFDRSKEKDRIRIKTAGLKGAYRR